MYAVVENNNITQFINYPKSIVIGEVRYPAKIFQVWSQAEKEVIGILFEVIKRLQTNNDLDQEYFEIMQKDDKNNKRIQDITNEREENSKIVGRLLEQLET